MAASGDKYVPDKPPKTPKADIGLGLAKATLSAIPLVGAPAAELLQTILTAPINARRDEWFEDIATELHDLVDKVEGLTVEKLCEDPSFITTIQSASRIAIGTHQAEKREALRNAVLNAALGHEPDEDFRAIFLSWVERFTPWHLKLLKLFANPSSLAKQTGFAPSGSLGSMGQLIEGVYADPSRAKGLLPSAM